MFSVGRITVVLALAASTAFAQEYRVGVGKAVALRDARTIRRAFPIKDMDIHVERIAFIAGNIDALMRVYHSELDRADKIDASALRSAADLLLASV